MNFEFHNPYFLLLFLLFIPLIIKDFAKKKKLGINVSTTKNMLVVEISIDSKISKNYQICYFVWAHFGIG
jgi:hypothetical protein